VIAIAADPKRPDSERPGYHCGNSGHPEWHVDSCHTHWPAAKESPELDAGQQNKEEAGDQRVTAHRCSLYEVCRPSMPTGVAPSLTGLKQLDRITRRILDDDLRAARPGHDVVRAEWHPDSP